MNTVPDSSSLELPVLSAHQIQIRVLAGSALLGAISWMFVLFPDIRVPGWGISFIDFIAVPWIVAFLLFGVRGGLITSVIGFISIGTFSEEIVPLVGAVSKFLAIVPLILIPPILLKRLPNRPFASETLSRPRVYVTLFIPAVLIRCVFMVFVNLFFAIPINVYYLFNVRLSPSEVPTAFYTWFWKWPMENLFGRHDFVNQVSASQLFVLFVVGVFLFNAWLSFLELTLSYFVVYPSGLHREFATW